MIGTRLTGLKIFHLGHGGDASGVAGSRFRVTNLSSGSGVPGTHIWPLHRLEARRIRRRDECFRGLIDLEAQLQHEVERDA